MMTEFTHSTKIDNKTDRLKRRLDAKKLAKYGTVALTIALAAKYGPGAIHEVLTDESQIVAGVPGQIETYDSLLFTTGKITGRTYHLGIEQCPSDVEAGEAGEYTASYNPDIGIIGSSCYVDWVKVSRSTYTSMSVGDEIVFEGTVGDPLFKMPNY